MVNTELSVTAKVPPGLRSRNASCAIFLIALSGHSWNCIHTRFKHNVYTCLTKDKKHAVYPTRWESYIPHKRLKQGQMILRASPCFRRFHGPISSSVCPRFFSYRYIEQQKESMEINQVPAEQVKVITT